MDAKVGDWVVTPRRGKAVEINALWYNALRLLEGWLARGRGDAERAGRSAEHAERARDSFNRRFWYAEGGYLYDVVDGEQAATTRPAGPTRSSPSRCTHPVLDRTRWEPVLDVVRERLLTPVGPALAGARASRLQAAATTATCAPATPPTTRGRSGPG